MPANGIKFRCLSLPRSLIHFKCPSEKIPDTCTNIDFQNCSIKFMLMTFELPFAHSKCQSQICSLFVVVSFRSAKLEREKTNNHNNNFCIFMSLLVAGWAFWKRINKFISILWLWCKWLLRWAKKTLLVVSGHTNPEKIKLMKNVSKLR